MYERLVTQFSNAGRYWKIYIEHEVCTLSLICVYRRLYEQMYILPVTCSLFLLSAFIHTVYLNVTVKIFWVKFAGK